jgi:hypothetical protein
MRRRSTKCQVVDLERGICTANALGRDLFPVVDLNAYRDRRSPIEFGAAGFTADAAVAEDIKLGKVPILGQVHEAIVLRVLHDIHGISHRGLELLLDDCQPKFGGHPDTGFTFEDMRQSQISKLERWFLSAFR